MATYLCTDVLFRQHRPAGEHPERPERLQAIEDALAAAGRRERCRPFPARPATEEELLRVHGADHLHDLSTRMGDNDPGGAGWLDPDTYYGPGSYAAALHAAGAAAALALHLLSSERDNGMALVRPPGHHATRDRAMGFCLLNNVAVAAAAARARGARVAIVDIDVHHGNGTEDIFAADPDVLYVSLHQYPFYPGSGAAAFTGRGLGRGSTVNVPLPQGSGDGVYRAAMKRVVLPALQRFAPDLLLCSAGFDGHRRDPLAGMNLGSAAYGEMAAQLLSVQPRLLGVLEGGYHLQALGESVAAFVAALLGDPAPSESVGVDLGAEPLSAEVQALLQGLRQLHHL